MVRKYKNGICRVCGERKPIPCKEICSSCYMSHYSDVTRPNTGAITKNKKCTVYLGCVVAETLLFNYFKNVTRMPIHNPGYDIICGLGYKVDIKSACFQFKRDLWQFTIDNNLIADRFLCLAFDNRKNLKPLYALFISQKEVIGLKHLLIRPSTLHLWDKYRIPIDGIVECCDSMKEK